MASTPKLDNPQALVTIAANAAAAGLANSFVVQDTIQTADIASAIATQVETTIGALITTKNETLKELREARTKLVSKLEEGAKELVAKSSASVLSAARALANALDVDKNKLEATFLQYNHDTKSDTKNKLLSITFVVKFTELVRSSSNRRGQSIGFQQNIEVFDDVAATKDLNDIQSSIYDADDEINMLSNEIINLKNEVSRIDRLERQIKSSLTMSTLAKSDGGQLASLGTLAAQVAASVTERAAEASKLSKLKKK